MDFLDIIWIIVCIVFLAVPDLVLNKKKKKSAHGRTRTSGPMPQMPENFPMPPMPSVPSEPESMPTDDEEKDFPVWTEPEEEDEQPEPQVQAVEQPKPVVVNEVAKIPASAARQAEVKQVDEAKKRDGLHIDPRNLVIYTAIMEPKFKEM